MPTGYTAKLYKGEEQSVRDFILTCARAFGAAVHQRDEAMGEPPRPREADTSYYDERIARAQAVLSEAATWTEDEAERRAREEHERAVGEWKKAEATRRQRRERYEAMLAEILPWTPPTPEHQGLKDFMVEQIRGSIQFDCSQYDPPKAETGDAYRARLIERAEKDVAYYQKERDEEIGRTEGANRWIAALYDSLPVTA